MTEKERNKFLDKVKIISKLIGYKQKIAKFKSRDGLIDHELIFFTYERLKSGEPGVYIDHMCKSKYDEKWRYLEFFGYVDDDFKLVSNEKFVQSIPNMLRLMDDKSDIDTCSLFNSINILIIEMI